jgi:hypothetical protein
MEQAKNIKLSLCVFKQLPGLKINFHNNKIFYFREANIMRINVLNFFFVVNIPFQVFNKHTVMVPIPSEIKQRRLGSCDG